MPMVFFSCCFSQTMLPLLLHQESLSCNALQCIFFLIYMALTVFFPNSPQRALNTFVHHRNQSEANGFACTEFFSIWEGTSLFHLQTPEVIIKYDLLVPTNTLLLSDVLCLAYRYPRIKHSNCATQM